MNLIEEICLFTWPLAYYISEAVLRRLLAKEVLHISALFCFLLCELCLFLFFLTKRLSRTRRLSGDTLVKELDLDTPIVIDDIIKLLLELGNLTIIRLHHLNWLVDKSQLIPHLLPLIKLNNVSPVQVDSCSLNGFLFLFVLHQL